MSAKQNTFLIGAVMILSIFSILYSYYSQGNTNSDVDEITRLILEGREIGNKRGNATLGAVGEAISEINTIQAELRDNLTAHRIVANETNQQVQELQNQTNHLIAQFNQTNEVERAKAVNKIVEGIDNNTILLEQLLEQK